MSKATKKPVDYTSYPEGYKRLCHDMLPWYFRPMSKMLIPLLLTILKDG